MAKGAQDSVLDHLAEVDGAWQCNFEHMDDILYALFPTRSGTGRKLVWATLYVEE